MQLHKLFGSASSQSSGEQNSEMKANGGENGTSTTAGGHMFSVNVSMHTSPVDQNAVFKSSGNTIGYTNENNSTPHSNDLNKGISFANENTENSNIKSYNNMNEHKSRLPAQKVFSKCSCILPPHVFLYNQLCVGKGIETAEGFSEDAGSFVYEIFSSVPSKKKGIGTEKERKETVIKIPGNILLSGLLAELDKEIYPNGESLNDGSEPDIKDCAFADNNNEYTEGMMKVDNEEEANFMVEEWE
eukprot:1618186-Ditylum_brightwellii.AAC.1